MLLEYNDGDRVAECGVWEPGRGQIIDGFVNLSNTLGEEEDGNYDDIDGGDKEDDDGYNSTQNKGNHHL